MWNWKKCKTKKSSYLIIITATRCHSWYFLLQVFLMDWEDCCLITSISLAGSVLIVRMNEVCSCWSVLCFLQVMRNLATSILHQLTNRTNWKRWSSLGRPTLPKLILGVSFMCFFYIFIFWVFASTAASMGLEQPNGQFIFYRSLHPPPLPPPCSLCLEFVLNLINCGLSPLWRGLPFGTWTHSLHAPPYKNLRRTPTLMATLSLKWDYHYSYVESDWSNLQELLSFLPALARRFADSPHHSEEMICPRVQLFSFLAFVTFTIHFWKVTVLSLVLLR